MLNINDGFVILNANEPRVPASMKVGVVNVDLNPGLYSVASSCTDRELVTAVTYKIFRNQIPRDTQQHIVQVRLIPGIGIGSNEWEITDRYRVGNITFTRIWCDGNCTLSSTFASELMDAIDEVQKIEPVNGIYLDGVLEQMISLRWYEIRTFFEMVRRYAKHISVPIVMTHCGERDPMMSRNMAMYDVDIAIQFAVNPERNHITVRWFNEANCRRILEDEYLFQYQK